MISYIVFGVCAAAFAISAGFSVFYVSRAIRRLETQLRAVVEAVTPGPDASRPPASELTWPVRDQHAVPFDPFESRVARRRRERNERGTKRG